MTTMFERLRHHAAERPDASAFSISDERGLTHLTYAALLERVRAFARGLEARGVGRGEPVALVLTTSPELVALVVAVQSLGAVPMIVNPSLPFAAIARRVAQVRAKLAVDPMLAAALPITSTPGDVTVPAAWATRASPRELAFLQLTSGTSGESRAAAVSHAALLANIEGTGPGDNGAGYNCYVNWVPLHHDLGLVRFLFTPLHYGVHAHHLPPALTSLGPWLRTLSATRATVTGAPDFAYRIAARSVPPEGLDLSGLLAATNGGEPVRMSTIESFERRFGCPGAIRPGYGLAEATLRVAATLIGEPLRSDARGNVGNGRVLPGLALRITLDGADGVAQPAGTIGQIEVSGPSLFEGYYDPSAPGGYDRSSFTADGWLRTGDTGYVDGDGVVFVLGRTRAMVKQAGALITPREVEEVTDTVAGVRFSAAIGLPNPWNDAEELVVVAEARAAPATLAEAERTALKDGILRAVREQVGVTPGRVMLVAPRTIPITPNGKIRHAFLRETLLADARSSGAGSAQG